MIRGRNDWPVELCTIDRVTSEGDSYSIGKSDGWSLFISKDECDGFVPKKGDWILTEQPVNNIATIIIEGRVIRHKSPKVVEAEHQAFRDSYRLKKLERYVTEGEELKERVKKLHPVFQKRMARFAAESGVEFWIDSAPYEMAVLEGAQALLNKVKELGLIHDIDNLYHGLNDPHLDEDGNFGDAIQWIEDWWALNTKEHNYDYKKQMEMVPEFGDGHSGNTAGMAYVFAKSVLNGEGDKL